MSCGKSIVRDIHVTVCRTDASPSISGSTAYVFTVHPRDSVQSSCGRPRRRPRVRHRSSMSDAIDFDAISLAPPIDRRFSDPSVIMRCPSLHQPASAFVHEVARTYSECRQLYQELRAFTDCRDMTTCCCILGSCPFWSMHTTLKKFSFPRKTLLSMQWSKTAIERQRITAFNEFMGVMCHQFQRYRGDFFLDRVSTTEFYGCKVIAAIESFLHLTDDVVDQVRDAERMLQRRMNLRGWRSDRKNLYFYEEESTRPAEEPRRRKHERAQRHLTSDSLWDSHLDTADADVDAIWEDMRR